METNAQPRIIVYTCITGDYDELTAPRTEDSSITYYCFTDRPLSATSPWQQVNVTGLNLSAKDKNRYLKMHPHLFLPDHDISVYLDGSIKIVGDIRALALSIADRYEDILLYDHPQRRCVYDEAAACAYFAHDWIWRLSRQMWRYKRLGYPENSGLFEAGVIIRRNTAQVAGLMDAWWREYCLGAKRDQLSLPFVSWLTGVTLGSLGSSDPRLHNKYLTFVNHRRRIRLQPILMKYCNRAALRALSTKSWFGKTTDSRTA